ncbi:hypothetical protein FB645_001893 [Coemansia sp. IMI 203386]|nr:hypothetical protein FB645_001893 [Coemansia sp. IMI 203386]
MVATNLPVGGTLLAVAGAYLVYTAAVESVSRYSKTTPWWPVFDDNFRSMYMWPAVLQLALGIALWALATSIVMGSYDARYHGVFGSVGNCNAPVECPGSGEVRLVDNRSQTGAAVLLVSVLQTALACAWLLKLANKPRNQEEDASYRFVVAFLKASAFVLAMSVTLYIRYLKSNRLLYSGLFTWLPSVVVFVECAVCMSEAYLSFFTADHISEPICGPGASSRSNHLVLLTLTTGLLFVAQSLVQQRPYFSRPVDGSLESSDPASSFMDRCSSSRFAGTNVISPLAQPSSVAQSDLVRSSESGSSSFSRLFFCWPGELMVKGAKRQLGFQDLYRLDDYTIPSNAWKQYQRHKKPGRSLMMTLFIAFAPEFLAQLFFALSESVLYFSGPFFLQRILRFIETHKNSPETGQMLGLRAAYLDTFGLLVFTVLTSLMAHRSLWTGCRIGILIKGLLVSELSMKTLQRSKAGVLEKSDGNDDSDDDGDDKDDALSASNGKIMNLLTADFERITEVAAHLDHIYALPVMLLVGIWYMYVLLGISAAVGMVIAIIYVPVSKALLQYLSRIESELNLLSDKRVAAITELLQGIKTVKLFGWETGFLHRIDEHREGQLKLMWKTLVAWAWIAVASTLAPMLILVVIFGVYAIGLGQQLTAEIAFTAISVFQLIRIVFEQLPGALNWLVGGYVSLQRINQYLQQPQLQSMDARVAKQDALNCGFGFAGADLEWAGERDASSEILPSKRVSSTEQTPLLADAQGGSQACSLTVSAASELAAPFALKDIDIRFPPGGLSLVAGPTGSGKSSLLAALIGEMTLTSGRILLPEPFGASADISSGPRFAYVAQEAWLRNATIRENILFDEPYNQHRYEETLRVCLLKPDLRILAAGDMTEIGERGVTLSGGQKQRIALARAVYSSRPVLLIDDCLSAVDAHTARHILAECLVGSSQLVAGRTRVLVTHHVSMCLPYAQHVVMMHEGRVVAQGQPLDLLASGLLADDKANSEHEGISRSSSTRSRPSIGNRHAGSGSLTPATAPKDLQTEDMYNSERLRKIADQKALDPAADLSALQGTLVKDEEREEGHVKLDTWRLYLGACGGSWFWAVLLVLLIVCQASFILQDYWVRVWVDASKDSGSSHPASFWLGIYVAIGVGSAVLRLVQMLFLSTGAICASRAIHKSLLRAVMHAAPRFFDSTPLGRIINRFSRDMQVIDEETINSVVWWTADVLSVVSVIAVIAFVIPAFLWVAAVVSVAYVGLAYYYLKTSRQLKRLESNSMSPLLSLFSELIQGSSTIRAFGSTKHYIQEAMDRMTMQNQPLYMVWASNRWLSVRIDSAGAVVSCACALFVLSNLDWIDAGLAGFLLSYSLTFSEHMVWVIRNYSSIEFDMNAVERVSQYLAIEQEAPLHAEPRDSPPADWPASGNVTVDSLVVEYVPGTRVLHGVSLSARHGEKIGVVGRTGAGKSTLSLALMRFVEPSSGRVVLDGVDISRVGLEELRRNVTIIPQDPTLFNGSVRYNLDPFGEYSDEHLWNAVQRSYLAKEASAGSDADKDVEGPRLTSGIFASLDAEITDNGLSLSLGQRQLVALARALVRQSRLIIMDEATASVDFATDDCIQRTIRGPEFANSTLFCIAHRLRTIIDYDRVLVLDKGQVVEFDTPAQLLQSPGGMFRSMCEESGDYAYFADQANAG